MVLEALQRGLSQIFVVTASTITSALPVGTTPVVDISSQQLATSGVISRFEQPLTTYAVSTNTYQIKSEFIAIDTTKDELKVIAKPETEVGVWVSTPAAQLTETPAGPEVPKPSPTPEPKKEEKKVLEKEATDSGEVKGVSEKKDPTTEQENKEEKKDEEKPKNSPEGSLSGDLLFQMTNDYRSKKGLPLLEKDQRLCKIAEQRGPQLQNEIFGSGRMHAGFYALKLPYWATENIAGYQTEQQAFNFWITDYIHRVAVEGDYKYSCVACYGRTCSQIFSSFETK